MKEFIKKLNLNIYKVAPVIIIFVVIWVFLAYTHPRNIFYNYKAVGFQNGFTGVAKPTVIEINGKYKNSILGNSDSFTGTIKLGNEIFDFTHKPLYFNKERMAVLVWDLSVGNAYSLIYVSPMFKELTIQTRDMYISAPCRHRTLAVQIANNLLHNIGRQWTVK